MRPLAVLLLALALCGCAQAPALVSHCSVSVNRNDQLVLTVTLTNLSQAEIVGIGVVADTSRAVRDGGNMLFKGAMRVGPGEARAVQAKLTDRGPVDFKDSADTRTGCELDHTDFADGGSWELPSPL